MTETQRWTKNGKKSTENEDDSKSNLIGTSEEPLSDSDNKSSNIEQNDSIEAHQTINYETD
ncbi:29840_t:CDS:2 [Racocetra persica]|uniref:29840_t:CDS:1 n=1 Tax=Racocetra persica TaxID=160502 RepID=A0ACA9KIH8_9GLOM|nr:29840_t:CDS:2 [Racocetra persica]